jgi:hypothetical protein
VDHIRQNIQQGPLYRVRDQIVVGALAGVESDVNPQVQSRHFLPNPTTRHNVLPYTIARKYIHSFKK